MKKISQVLIESQKTRKQIVGSLFGLDATKVIEIKEYCALGALFCEAGMVSDGEDGRIVQSKGRVELMKFYLGEYKKSKINKGECEVCKDAEYVQQIIERIQKNSHIQ